MMDDPRSSIPNSKKGFVKNLFQDVVDSGLCTGCSACIVACPVAALAYRDEKPVLLENCIDCVLCFSACPRTDRPTAMEQGPQVGGLGTALSEAVGQYRHILATRASRESVRAVGQDGGSVTALLTWALQAGLIDGAVVARRSSEHPWQPVPAVVTTPEELIACAGSAYTYSPNTLALREAAERGLSKVAFVGTGCSISAVRQLQKARSKRTRELVAPAAFSIGLLCSESFQYRPFIHGAIAEGLGVSLDEVVKVNIKGRILVTLRSGEVHSIALKTVRPFARTGCHYCHDFGAEGADISMGGLGLDGWTVATVRTPLGEQLVNGAAGDGFLELMAGQSFPDALELYRRLATKQRERPSRPTPNSDEPRTV